MEVIEIHAPKPTPVSFTVKLSGEEVAILEATLGDTIDIQGDELYKALSNLVEEHQLPKWEVDGNHRLKPVED